MFGLDESFILEAAVIHERVAAVHDQSVSDGMGDPHAHHTAAEHHRYAAEQDRRVARIDEQRADDEDTPRRSLASNAVNSLVTTSVSSESARFTGGRFALLGRVASEVSGAVGGQSAVDDGPCHLGGGDPVA